MYVRIVEVPGIVGAGILIGMDIIGMGDLSVFTELGKTVMTFRTPSIGGEDFVAIADRINRERALLDKFNRDTQARKQLTLKEREKRRIKKKMQQISRKKNRKH